MITRRKVALCIGLNYPGTTAELSGCVNDANDWAGVLAGYGYDTTVMLEPTKDQVVCAIRDTVATLRFGDRLVITYSGHGSWVPDRSGDEADGRDEVLVLSDYRRGGLLSDDEIHQLLGAARFGVRRLLLSDSCHSGSVTRFASIPLAHLGNRAPAKTRYLPPAMFLRERGDLEAAMRVEAASAVSPPRKGTVLISGCGDLEYSYDAWFNGRANGAFTKAAIAQLSAGVRIGAWHQAIRKVLPSQDYPQSPELTALRHQRYWAPF